jgi:5S rRNA maturation endonuclease (ribonuclease M5)
MMPKKKTLISKADGKYRLSSPNTKKKLINISIEGKNDEYRFANFIQDENLEVNSFRTCAQFLPHINLNNSL